MIAKITRGADPGRIGAYLHGPGRAEEHVYDDRLGGAVIAGTVPVLEARSPVEWVAEMRAAIDRRPDIVGPVWQVSLRQAPGDRVLDDREWADAAQGFAQRMGFADHPWVAVRHAEDHVHLVVSRVDHDGVVWHARQDRWAAQAACAVLEVEHGLARAPRTRAVPVVAGERVVDRRQVDGQLTQGEWRRAVATKATPTRMTLTDRVHTAATLAAGRGRTAFEDELARLRVAYQANEASTGRMNGYRFADPTHVDPAGVPVWFKASQLDKSLSWAALSTRLADPPLHPQEEPARRRLQTRTGRAREMAAAHDLARGRRDATAAAVRDGAPRSLRFTDRAWQQLWEQRAAVDPAKTRNDDLRRRAGITPQVGDVVNAPELVAYVDYRYQQQLWERANTPPPPSRGRPIQPGDLEPSRYQPPSPGHDPGRGIGR